MQGTETFLTFRHILKAIAVKYEHKVNRDLYKNKDVKDKLRKIYSGKCCYCETRLGVSGFERIDQLAKIAMDSLMTPGMQILVARYGKIVFNKSYGFHTYEKKIPVTNTDIYDLASLTKILTTLPILIQEVDQNKLTLDTTLGSLKDEWKNSNKADIRIKDMLSHQSKIIRFIMKVK